MDDVLLFYSKAPSFDHDRFIRDLEADCYWPPLKLEPPPSGGVFLESQFEIRDRHIEFRLKNANEEETRVWRYHHFASHSNETHKKATLMASLRKVHTYASEQRQTYLSATAKLREFSALGYPRSMRREACTVLARDTGNTIWYRVRDVQ